MAPAVTIHAVEVRPVAETFEATGSVVAREDVPVGAEIGGLSAIEVLVDEGQYVQGGAVLVRLNDAVLRAQLGQQDAAIAGAQASLTEASRALVRSQDLQHKGYLATSALDSALSRGQTAQAQLDQARAARAETLARLAQTTLRAPVAGLIVRRSVTQGQIVAAGAVLFHLVRDGQLELNAQLPEAAVASVKPGLVVEVASDQVGRARGVVRIVASEVDAQTRLGIARIAIVDPGAFRPGMFARARIEVAGSSAAVVPNAALVYRSDRPGVFVVGGDRRARFRPVNLGRAFPAETAVRGLVGGEHIVVAGAGFLSDGDLVRPVLPAGGS
jgi:RND family efflux transporter MFP subunit